MRTSSECVSRVSDLRLRCKSRSQSRVNTGANRLRQKSSQQIQVAVLLLVLVYRGARQISKWLRPLCKTVEKTKTARPNRPRCNEKSTITEGVRHPDSFVNGRDGEREHSARSGWHFASQHPSVCLHAGGNQSRDTRWPALRILGDLRATRQHAG